MSMIYVDGYYSVITTLMKCFNFIWTISIWSFTNDFLMSAVGFYLTIVKGMYFKGSVLATLAYLFSVLSYGLPWLMLILNIEKDIHEVDFEEENEDETEESQWIEKKQDQKLTLN